MRTIFLTLLTSLLWFMPFNTATAASPKPNLLFITVDDMSCDSVGIYGCELKDTSPHMDRLAADGLRFLHAHVQVGNCMPSRNVMFSGRYPHNNRVEGFYQVRDIDYPVMADLMKAGGYFVGIRGKVPHSTPYHPYPAWDIVLDEMPDGTRAHPKNAASYGISTRQGIEAAKKAGKPFCLNINISDPHKPFYAEGKGGVTVPDPNVPTRVFTPEEIPVPRFLPDDPIVRKEMAHYYSSVRRADDCLGEVLKALKESGEENNTMVMFLSDHGMPLPFAKTQLYFHSTRTPWIVRWPGVTRPDTADDRHLISAVDLLPTLLDIAGIPHPKGFDGRSFLPLLRGETQTDRDMVVTEHNENAGGHRNPMRSVVTREFAYLFNPWSNGERVMATATAGTSTYRRMKELAKTDPEVAARLQLFDHRVPEELYNYGADPDALINHVNDPQYRADYERLTKALEAWMKRTGDPLLEVFQKRSDPAAREAYMKKVEAEAAARGKRRGAKQANAKSAPAAGQPAAAKRTAKPAGKPQPAADLISLQTPASGTPGQPVTVKVPHRIPASLGEQLLHITLKAGTDDRRLDRQVIKASGEGVAEVSFDLPASVPGNRIRFAAFIGEDHPRNLQHLNSDPIPVKPAGK
jgi:N-sulfoglucosamine sulfohydrolase